MARNQTNQGSGFIQSIKKFTLSAFVVITFIAYYIHERQTNPANAGNGNTAANISETPTVAAQTAPAPTGSVPTESAPAGNTPTLATVPAGTGYKNGTYTGPVVNAYYGNVQVQVVIQNGKIADVKFLDYPHDRRTSQMINAQATPWLTQEAIQAQSANVNIITGATLTSQAFLSSLQSALNSASN
ncbi:MAG: FMN-binding protein [Anaerolineales bacterium]